MKTQLTKEKILKAGIQEFGQNGYAGGSVNAICATGINKGLIYHNYKDKDDLYLACVKRMIADMVSDIEAQMSKEVTYNAARMHFFSSHEMEARLFLEIMVNPPQKLEAKIKAVMMEILGVDESEIEEDSAIGDLPNWDSLNHLRIIAEVEKLFDIQFTPDVLMDIEDFSDLVKVTKERV